MKKKFHLNQIQLFHVYNKYFKNHSNYLFIKNNNLFIKNKLVIYTIDLKKGSLENFYFINFSKTDNKTLKSNKIYAYLLFPLKNSFNIFSKRSIYNFSWNVIGAYTSFKNTNQKTFQICLKSNLNFYNLIYEIYYMVRFDSTFDYMNDLLLTKTIQKLNMKIFVVNKQPVDIKFKSLINIKFILGNRSNSLINKRIFGLQGLKHFEKGELKINISKFLILNNHFTESIFINVTREKLFLIINPKIIYKIENIRGFSEFLIQRSGQLVSFGSANLIRNIYLKKNEIFIGETVISAIFEKF